MRMIFQNGGILTTVQDLGRTGFGKSGINPNGAMDSAAVRLINILLGNAETESVLEMHFPAPKILFSEDTLIALGGANFAARIGENKIKNWRSVFIKKGSVLSFSQKVSGNRCYLAVEGGLKIEKWLNSGSTNLKAGVGGFKGRKLEKGDEIFFKENISIKPKRIVGISKTILPLYSSSPTVRVIAGAEFEKLSDKSQKVFQTENFTIRHESDRMGFRLDGRSLNLQKPLELVSSAVAFGTIQLLPGGQMIILMADHQTTGGYPRIANIVSRDLPLVAQLGANDHLNFKVISIQEAENLSLELEKDLNLLKTACRFL